MKILGLMAPGPVWKDQLFCIYAQVAPVIKIFELKKKDLQAFCTGYFMLFGCIR